MYNYTICIKTQVSTLILSGQTCVDLVLCRLDGEGYSGWTIPQIVNDIDNRLNTYNLDVVLLQHCS
ncbi:MAG TPA: hypothetical protein PK604_11400 [Acetivibrio clariflavus]|nr:hypothetical protein [Acetivibrio clariflavus]